MTASEAVPSRKTKPKGKQAVETEFILVWKWNWLQVIWSEELEPTFLYQARNSDPTLSLIGALTHTHTHIGNYWHRSPWCGALTAAGNWIVAYVMLREL